MKKRKKVVKKKRKKAARKTVKKKVVKKVTKRKTVKKTVPKVKVTITRKVLGKAPETKTFYLKDGRKIRTVYELIDELELMTEDTFKHYVSDIENHFANWLEHVFNEKNLAGELRQIKGRMETQRALLKHLVRELVKQKA